MVNWFRMNMIYMILTKKNYIKKPNQNIDAPLGKFEELKAVEDAVRYMKKGNKLHF